MSPRVRALKANESVPGTQRPRADDARVLKRRGTLPGANDTHIVPHRRGGLEDHPACTDDGRKHRRGDRVEWLGQGAGRAEQYVRRHGTGAPRRRVPLQVAVREVWRVSPTGSLCVRVTALTIQYC